jgi:hypothetical protein
VQGGRRCFTGRGGDPRLRAGQRQQPQIPLARSARWRSARSRRAGGRSSATELRGRRRSDDDDDSQSFGEYLLYHRIEGFTSIVDAETAGADRADHRRAGKGRDGVRRRGRAYRKLYDYTGKVTYVLGEFGSHAPPADPQQ